MQVERCVFFYTNFENHAHQSKSHAPSKEDQMFECAKCHENPKKLTSV